MKNKKIFSKFKIKDSFIIYSLLLIILLFGLDLRVRDIPEENTFNTVSFYYARTKELYGSGQYPIEDSKSLHPLVYEANSPPLISFFTVAIYKLIEIFGVDFYSFVIFSPAMVYVLLFLLGFFILSRLYNKITGIFFVFLLTIVPAANKLTVKGYFTEEALGVLLILASIYFITKSEKNNRYIPLTIVAITLLELTWQVFTFVLLGVLILLILNIKSKKHLIKYLSFLVIPLLLAHIISVYLIDTAYSPVYMFKETYLGITKSDTVDFWIALDRDKLQPMDLDSFILEYGYIVFIFLIFGLCICIKNIKEPKYHIILIYTILSIVFLLKYTKFRFLALMPLLITSSIGLEAVLNRFKKYKKPFIVIFIATIILLLVTMIYHPKCQMELNVPMEDMRINKSYEVVLQLKNTGKDAFCDANILTKNRPFSGLHIETENAKIIDKNVYSMYTPTKVINYDPANETDWFEVKIDCLQSGAVVNVTFNIVPYKLPVKLNYRCWIPDECNLKPPIGLSPNYNVSWRNEKCLQRTPNKGKFCDVKVYAGYNKKQDYYCLSKELG